MITDILDYIDTMPGIECIFWLVFMYIFLVGLGYILEWLVGKFS